VAPANTAPTKLWRTIFFYRPAKTNGSAEFFANKGTALPIQNTTLWRCQQGFTAWHATSTWPALLKSPAIVMQTYHCDCSSQHTIPSGSVNVYEAAEYFLPQIYRWVGTPVIDARSEALPI